MMRDVKGSGGREEDPAGEPEEGGGGPEDDTDDDGLRKDDDRRGRMIGNTAATQAVPGHHTGELVWPTPAPGFYNGIFCT